MRTVGWMTALLALAATVGAQDIYRWKDTAGNVHYSSMPSPGATSTSGTKAPAARADTEGDAAARDADALSADVSLRRNALERDLRATEKRIHDIDDRLAVLQRARGQRANGSVATGGVGTNLDVRSEEEKTLAEEREKLAQHVAEIRNDGEKLRTEVTTRLGGTPAWWNDVR